MIPVVAVVGHSNSGKTTVAAHLTASLSFQGYRVASIKHCHDGHDIDRHESDTDRLRKAGAAVVIACSPGQLTTMEYPKGDLSLESLALTINNDIDIVIAEGFKSSSVPKILIARNGPPPIVENVFAVVGDPASEYEYDLPIYGFDQLDTLASLLRQEFLDVERPKESVSLIVDGEAIPLRQFPTSALMGIVKGFVSSLNGVPDGPSEIQITFKSRRDVSLPQSSGINS